MTQALPSNSAYRAPHDAIAKTPQGLVGFNRYWTARAIRMLRTVAKNPFIRQRRNSYGSLDANGHGSVCANQVLIELLDNLRNEGGEAAINRVLPVRSSDIIDWNDRGYLSFEQIATKIEQAAGGPEALVEA